ncbi:MAG: histidine phosphatase family protein [Faecalibacterium sp.]|nr:histidine phosphatase family protein [Faecalibacterium sp.]
MRLIFIRHAEPDYSVDSLTEAGFREAALLAKRTAQWDVTAYFVSPLGRAQATAAPTLAQTGRTAQTLDWLREFSCGEYQMPDRENKTKKVPWDFLPEYWTARPEFADRDRWMQLPVMQAMPQNIETRFAEVCTGIDGLLAQYGYRREGGIYRVEEAALRDATLVFFCHLGVTGAIAGHLLNMAPPLLWQSFFLPPSSVTVLNTEEQTPGIAAFRCQMMGDTAHLRGSGEPVSAMGAFGPVFDESRPIF